MPDDMSVRPTVDHFKKHILRIFSTFPHAHFWDLYAGSGGVGIEFLSNGASSGVFVEVSTKAVNCLKLNLAECGLKMPGNFNSQSTKVAKTSTEQFLTKTEPERPPNFIFIDPPYGEGHLARAIELIQKCKWVNPRTPILIEHATDEAIPKELVHVQEQYGPKSLTLILKTSRS